MCRQSARYPLIANQTWPLTSTFSGGIQGDRRMNTELPAALLMIGFIAVFLFIGWVIGAAH